MKCIDKLIYLLSTLLVSSLCTRICKYNTFKCHKPQTVPKAS